MLTEQPGLDQANANARLIAEAPAMAEALGEVMEWISNWNPNFEQDDEWPATRDKARAILARIKGATP